MLASPTCQKPWPTRASAASGHRAMTVRDAFTHTTGVTYGFLFQHEVDALYRREKIGNIGEGDGETLGEMCARIAKLPVLPSTL